MRRLWSKLMERMRPSSQAHAAGQDRRTSEERHLEHAVRNFSQVAQGAVRVANARARREENSEKKQELKDAIGNSESTVDAIVREMQGRK